MIKGFYTFVHHEGPLIEWSDNIEERLAYIESQKPEHERAIRRRHIQRVPEARLPALYAARAAYQAVQRPVWAACEVVQRQILADPATLALVRELVPDCQWDGTTIFGAEKEVVK